MKAVIVGGGFAGLTAGYYLQKAGWDVTVLEAADAVGGRVRTVRKQGYTLDVGATQMSSGYKQYLELCGELGMAGDVFTSWQVIGLMRDGRVHDFDGTKLLRAAFTPALSWGAKFDLLKVISDGKKIQPPIDVFDVSKSHAVDTESAADYAQRRLSTELYDYVVDPIVRTYVMNHSKAVSALEFFSAFANLGGQTMLSLSGGNDRLPAALAKHVDVRLRTRVTAVDDHANKSDRSKPIVIEATDANGALQRLECDACVLATRLPEALEVYPAAREMAGDFGRDLKYNRAWVAQLGYAVAPAQKVIGVLVPEVECLEVGLIWCEHNKNPDRAPPGHALFTVYSDEAANTEMLARSDAQLIAFATNLVEKLFPDVRGRQDLAHLTRWPRAIPNPAPGMYRKLAAFKVRMDPRARVQLAGDYLTCTGQNSAIFYGRRAAENLIARRG